MCRVYVLFAIPVIISSVIAKRPEEETFKFVSVVFRHGDRAPDPGELYPNDPHLHNDFFPMGHGGLTNQGKMREYTLGKMLRKRYGDFLGEIYFPEDIDARSTNVLRTKMTLSLVLAALYPPAKPQQWNPDFSWQPIPTTYESGKDVLLRPSHCPRFQREYNRVLSSPRVRNEMKKFRFLTTDLTDFTGRRIDSTNDIFFLYHGLMAEHSMGLKLPEWIEPLFPRGPLHDAVLFEYKILSYNDLLKKLNGGTLLKRISDDMVATTKKVTRIAQKMNIFSGHEVNVVALLQTLGLYEPHVPEYSSAVIVELILRDGQYYVKVLYYLGIPPEVKTLRIPGCEELCPLEDFLKLLKNVTPSEGDLAC